MDNATTNLINVDVILELVSGSNEVAEDGVAGRIVEGWIDDMVEGMDSNVGGSVGGKEAD